MNIGRYVVLMILMLMLASVTTSAQKLIEVQWATFLGGSGKDEMRDLCVDRDDNVYVCGVFTSTDFPKPRNVPTSFDTVGPGGYLASFSPTGEMRWLQYFSCVRPLEIAISDAGVLVMVGSIANQCGNLDATVSTFTTLGERFARDQLLGGSEPDVATSVDIIGTTIYVGGVTESRDFPTTANAFQANYQGGGVTGQGIGDGFVAKLSLVQSPNGWQLVPDVVTYFGGRYLDEVLVVRAMYGLGSVYIGGRTRSDKLPGSPYIQDRIGTVLDDDGFIAKLDASSLVCQWSMFCGGAGNEVVHGLQPVPVTEVPSGTQSINLRVCGTFNGSPFPFPGQPATLAPYAGGSALGGDAFYFEISERFARVSFLRQISTSGDDIATALTRDAGGLIGPLLFSNGKINEFTPSVGFDAYLWNATVPSNVSTIVSEYEGNGDEVTIDAEQMRFGFGGNDASPSPNSSYICGSTTSTLIPGTEISGPIFQRTSGGGRDGFLVKIGCGTRRTKLVVSDTLLCDSSQTVTLSLEPPPLNVFWFDGSTQGPTRTVQGPGVYQVTFNEYRDCLYADIAVVRMTVRPSGRIAPSDTIVLCDTVGVLLAISGTNIARVEWSNGNVGTDTTLLVRTPGRYSAVIYSSDGCSAATDTVTVVTSSSSGGTPILLSYAGADSATVGSTVRVIMRVAAPNGTKLESLPTDWSAVVRFNKTMLFPVRPLGRGTTDDSLRSIRIAGRRKPSSDTLGTFDLRVALGERDSTSIIVDSLDFDPCVAGDTPTQLPFRTAGICRIDSVGRFITFRRARLAVAVASNPVGPDGAIGSAVGEDLSQASARIVSIIGEEIHLGSGASMGDVSEWTIPSWLPVGRYVFVVTSAAASASTIFEVVR